LGVEKKKERGHLLIGEGRTCNTEESRQPGKGKLGFVGVRGRSLTIHVRLQ